MTYGELQQRARDSRDIADYALENLKNHALVFSEVGVLTRSFVRAVKLAEKTEDEAVFYESALELASESD